MLKIYIIFKYLGAEHALVLVAASKSGAIRFFEPSQSEYIVAVETDAQNDSNRRQKRNGFDRLGDDSKEIRKWCPIFWCAERPLEFLSTFGPTRYVNEANFGRLKFY